MVRGSPRPMPRSSITESAKRHWRRTEELFHAAGEVSPAERQAFLLRSCDGDHAWVEEIEALLDATFEVDDHVVDVIAKTLHLATEDGGASPPALDRVGPYKILEELGQGGMSTVFLAERADHHYRKLVALKVVKRGMDTGEILRRLRQERQILAQLEHANISRLLDGGNTDDGLPYVVMEYVDGEPIDRYCRRLELGVEERLALFRDVLAAVAYAHRNLVVHRDLKPANILVTAGGEVKLLDFGIAKLLDPELAAEFGNTAAALRFFTLDYASPEQILGKPLNTASDIYSLGVLLFELLSGRRPHGPGLGRREMERAICELDPQPPSGGIDTDTARGKALRRRLQGDLDAIVGNALRRQESRRYLSVEQFAEDLRRHLQGLPVKARRDTLAYRAGKFLRRHRLGVSAALAATLTLAGSITFHTVRLAAERNRAQVESDKSNQVASFLRGLFENADPGRGRGAQVTARELLDQGAARIDAELADQPEVQAELMDLMGSVYLDLGLYEDADPLLQVSEELRRERFGAQAEETLASRLHRGQWLHAVGEYDRAEAAFEELLQAQPAAGADSQWAEILGAHADLLFDRRRPEEAEALFRQALEIRRRLHGEEHPLVARSLNDLGAALYARGKLEAAEEALRQALALRRRLLGADHPHLAITLSTLGVLRLAQDDTEEAVELLTAALAIRRRVYGNRHPSVSDTLNNLGEVCRRRGELDAAFEYLSEALEIVRVVQGTQHPVYADSLANLARTSQVRGDASAIDLYRQAVTATHAAYGEDSEKLVYVLQYLGDALAGQDDPEGAEAAYLRALEIRRRLYPQGHWRVSFPLLRLGRVRLARGDPAAAEPFLNEAWQMRSDLRPEHWRTAEAESWLGSCWVALGREGEGRELLSRALARLEEVQGEEEPATLEARERLARAEAPGHGSSSSSPQ